ncbi:MAG: ATP-binding cassette domain-containing protein [Candidatus Aenigmarchaeota archaeon]|nr:ATP-binding cassette domain-containing protein [Candidatus Aenigmarchaeota archaeon]
MKAILTRELSKTYWFYEKEEGLAGSVQALFRGKKVFVEAVGGIDLDVEMGEVVGFIGPNGAGKTTTLKMLSGILHPTSGEVKVMGYLPFKREKPFLKKITFVTGQRNRLFWDLPAQEYFNFCRVAYDIPREVYQKNLANLVELANIEDILKVPQRKLSFGQRKLCELVAAMVHDPRIIFLDEPTNALDLINARKIREFLKEKGKEGKQTIIVTSHNISDIEQVCERVLIMNGGNIVFDGSMRELSNLDGLKKQMRIVFNGPWTMDLIKKYGEIRQMNDDEVLLEIERDHVPSVTSHLFGSFPIKDISITDPPMERIVESIYLRTSM